MSVKDCKIRELLEGCDSIDEVGLWGEAKLCAYH